MRNGGPGFEVEQLGGGPAFGRGFVAVSVA